ncbi:TonB-dependent receptor domain-containing protein [Marinobacter lutaoensis]|nr:TonB-dependent receptor [Marinobacter lutaoensis]
MTQTPLARVIGLMVAGAAALPAQAQTLDSSPLIRVTEGQSPETARLAEAALTPEPVSRLDADPAVSLSRMGGRGLEPVVRGQSRERVDVLLDGIRVEGACPNRMDPPTSRLSAALPPALEVRTSNRTLRWGAIAGGQVVATTAAPDFGDGASTGHLTVGGADNGDGWLVNGSAAVGSDEAWLRLAAGYDEADDYQDGDGETVRSAYQNTEGRLDGAWTSDSGLYVKGMASRQEERDVKYAGAGMDAPKTDTDLYRLELGAPVANGGWNLMAWQADVDHVMDNFSLRDATMKMLTASETRTRGARLTLDQSIGYTKDLAVGVDVESNDWDATMYNGMALDNTASLLWPGVERDRVGLFAEAFHRIRVNLRLGAGLRYDRVEMDATRAGDSFRMNPTSMPMTPASVYQSVYGVTDVDAVDDNISGFLSGDWRFSDRQALELTASHSVRSPGVTERYIVRGTGWVGNPGLDTEKHHKLELALSGQDGNWQWRPALWVDRVDDFVLRDQTPSDQVRYRSVSARLLGVEAALQWNNGRWSTRSKLASVRGENRDDGTALPQIPPVQFVQTLAWQAQGHTLQAEWQVARRQERIDPVSGLDAGPSAGYGVLNLSGNHPLMRNLSLGWALDNLFDKAWAPHVSRANTDPFNPEAVRVNEPGRTLRVALTARW